MIAFFLAAFIGSTFDDVTQAEMATVRALFPAPTKTCVADGNWTDPATWGGVVPTAADEVLIPFARIVTIDGNAECHRLMVKGRLYFSRAASTSLTLDTFISDADSTVEIGTRENPIPPEVSATITFIGSGFPDAKRFSRGALLMGAVEINGSPKTAWQAFPGSPIGWKDAEHVLYPGENPNRVEDEVRAFSKPSLTYKHRIRASLDRNVIFRSAVADPIESRGHVMLMHGDNPKAVRFARFENCGRTDKRVPLDNPLLEPLAQGPRSVPAPGNKVGRYPLHIHRCGVRAEDPTMDVEGCVVEGSNGWGIVAHSSKVRFLRNVVYNVTGSGIIAEAGNEVGAFDENLVCRVASSGNDIQARTDIQDFGHDGWGYWITSPTVRNFGNVAFGCRGGFNLFSKGLIEVTLGRAETPSWALKNPAWAGGKPTHPLTNTPVNYWLGSAAIGCGRVFDTWFHFPGDASGNKIESLITGMVGDRVNSGAVFVYTQKLKAQWCDFKGETNSAFAFSSTGPTGYITIQNCTMNGFQTGVETPQILENEIHDCNITCKYGVNVRVPQGNPTPRGVKMDRNKFTPFGGGLWDVYLPARPTGEESKVLGDVFLNGKRLHYLEDQALYPSGSRPARVRAWVEN